jgi:hypothetical protein
MADKPAQLPSRAVTPLTMKSLDADLASHKAVSDIRHDTLNERIAALEEQVKTLQQAVGELVTSVAAGAGSTKRCRIFADGRLHCCD